MTQNRTRKMFSNHWRGSARVAATSMFRAFLSIPASVALGCIAQTPMADSFNPGAQGAVYVIAVQVDGKILVGGNFDLLAGQPCSRIGRLNPDGTLDSGFNRPTTDSYVTTFAMQADRKILVGGVFTKVGGQAYTHIARLNSDGTLDKGFTSPFLPPVDPFQDFSIVDSVTVRPNGKIIVTGSYLKINGMTGLWSLVQLNEDGSLDDTFTSSASAYNPILLPDGKLLVYKNGGIYRLNSNGTLDESFQGFSQPGVSLAGQPDGKVLVSGSFSAFLGEARTNLVRLNADGTLDAGFNPLVRGFVYAMALQADGKIVLGGPGSSMSIAGQTNCIGRLNADGSIDSTFNTAVSSWGYVDALAVQADGKILIGGYFDRVGEEWRTNIGRLNATEPVTENLQCDGGTLTWLRAGGGPECSHVEFQCSSNWVDWASLGTATWAAGAWRLSGISVPTNSAIRVRGSVTAQNGPSSANWFVESATSPPGGPGPLLQFLELREGRLRCRVIGPTATTWRVLRSADLCSWVQDDTLGTVRLEGTQATFEVPIGNDLAGFYRLVKQ